jgi:hypothetical protein
MARSRTTETVERQDGGVIASVAGSAKVFITCQ